MKEKRSRKGLQWILLFILVAFVVGIAIFLYQTGFFEAVHSINSMRAYIEHFSTHSYIIYFIVQLASVIIAPIPSNVTALAGAALFGSIPAFLLTYAAVVLGAVLVFQLARILGQPFVERFISRRDMDKYMEVIRRKENIFFIMAFLLPGFPDDLLCFLAGLTEMPLKRFAIIVALCRPWGLLVSCMLGGSILEFPIWAIVLIVLLAIVLFVIAMKYGDRWEESILKKLKK